MPFLHSHRDSLPARMLGHYASFVDTGALNQKLDRQLVNSEQYVPGRVDCPWTLQDIYHAQMRIVNAAIRTYGPDVDRQTVLDALRACGLDVDTRAAFRSNRKRAS